MKFGTSQNWNMASEIRLLNGMNRLLVAMNIILGGRLNAGKVPYIVWFSGVNCKSMIIPK